MNIPSLGPVFVSTCMAMQKMYNLMIYLRTDCPAKTFNSLWVNC